MHSRAPPRRPSCLAVGTTQKQKSPDRIGAFSFFGLFLFSSDDLQGHIVWHFSVMIKLHGGASATL